MQAATVPEAVLHDVPPEDTRPPTLPRGRHAYLGERGKIFFREVEGPAGAPVILLLHGWIASAGLNWLHAFGPLGDHFRVIAPDLRGHGRGIRSREPFQLEDCADDVAALLAALGIESAIAVGYSMGGPVAKLLWKRHPGSVSGLVLCATSHVPVRGTPRGRAAFASAMDVAARTTRFAQATTWMTTTLRRQIMDVIGDPDSPHAPWALSEIGRHDPRMLMEAGAALGRFNAESWFRAIEIPTAVVVTTKDRAILPEDQMLLGIHIPKATVYSLDLGHGACVDPRFATELRTACLDVANRAAPQPDPRRRARVHRWIQLRVDALIG